MVHGAFAGASSTLMAPRFVVSVTVAGLSSAVAGGTPTSRVASPPRVPRTYSHVVPVVAAGVVVLGLADEADMVVRGATLVVSSLPTALPVVVEAQPATTNAAPTTSAASFLTRSSRS
ncbi:hypothetical protein Acsp05_66400 [Actinokineospora sp. NBRC 105648]|nr:hypothetical protein Acsp05_66400 [Actinokineospora sp. NBRC 105648]